MNPKMKYYRNKHRNQCTVRSTKEMEVEGSTPNNKRVPLPNYKPFKTWMREHMHNFIVAMGVQLQSKKVIKILNSNPRFGGQL